VTGWEWLSIAAWVIVVLSLPLRLTGVVPVLLPSYVAGLLDMFILLHNTPVVWRAVCRMADVRRQAGRDLNR